MTTIRLHNTLARRKEEFAPLDPSNVRMYVCGPTVYDRAHLGNARPVVVFDVLFRLLRHVYGPDHVTYVRNFTDVDDKINARAAETGRSIREITDETIGWYHEDMDALGALRPTHEPRATEYIEQMKAMISVLIERGHAYVVREPSNDPPQEYVIFDRGSYDAAHALFDVESYAEYGRLSGRSVEDMIAGARVEVAPYKRSPADFVLWKPSDAATPGWDSPWGRGRPGWHIECSAMARELLGASFDIHGGGLDLQFPHHENEVAQSKCAHPGEGFAQVWMHNEMLLVDGKKMSKSLGNFFTVRDLLEQGVPGEVIRFVLLGTHYGKRMDWTETIKEDAFGELRAWRRAIEGVDEGEIDPEFLSVLKEDLNTHLALQRLGELYVNERWNDLKATASLLGLLTDEVGDWFRKEQMAEWEEQDSKIRQLIQRRARARSDRDYALSDQIRLLLASDGIELRDVPGNKVRPRLDFSHFMRWLIELTADERAKYFGEKYRAGNAPQDAPDFYQEWVADKVLRKLER